MAGKAVIDSPVVNDWQYVRYTWAKPMNAEHCVAPPANRKTEIPQAILHHHSAKNNAYRASDSSQKFGLL